MASVPPDHIAITNVRPAYAASLEVGLSPGELAALGLPVELFDDPEATVPGAVTYAHFERVNDVLGSSLGAMGAFVTNAARRHTLSSLGVVGLACKTAPTVGEAMAHHARFQQLTNRTASYAWAVDGPRLVVTEARPGPVRPGLLLVSDYALLVAVQLLRTITSAPVRVLGMHSRRDTLGSDRAALEAFLDAEISTGSAHAQLVLDASLLGAGVVSADAELAAYFRGILQRAGPVDPAEPEIVSRLRGAVRDALATGTPTSAAVARGLGMSTRTLQRRLSEVGTTFEAVLNGTRVLLAEGYLGDPELTLTEVAYLLGYRDETSFWRAFRRWKGSTPAAWRSSRQSGSGPATRSC